MEKKFKFEKGEDCYDVVGSIKEEIDLILNKEFEDIYACLKSDIKVTIKIDIDKLAGEKLI